MTDPIPQGTEAAAPPPDNAELRLLIGERLESIDGLTPGLRREIAVAVMDLLGNDFARFRAMYLAASITDATRAAAFEEYLRRRAAIAGRPLGPDEVAATISDFERLPAAYVSELAAPVPPPMPAAFPDSAGQMGAASRRRIRLFPNWSDIKFEIIKGGSIVGVAGMAALIWQASQSLEVTGLLLVCGMAIVLYFFRRRGL